jgi:hypothetical protein
MFLRRGLDEVFTVLPDGSCAVAANSARHSGAQDSTNSEFLAEQILRPEGRRCVKRVGVTCSRSVPVLCACLITGRNWKRTAVLLA